VKIDFPKINKSFSCTEYAPEADIPFTVWVNPETKKLSDLAGAYKEYQEKGEEARDAFLTILSEILSQTDNKWSAEDLRELQDKTLETDPMFWLWLQDRILKEISAHRFALKKA
jgi:hypothetical protein